MKKLFFLLLFTPIFLIGLLSNAGNAYAGVGVSPALMTVKNLSNGVKVQKSLFLSRADASEDAYYKVSLEKDGSRYIELIEEIVEMPAGKKEVEYPFYIYPQSAAKGEHKANLIFTTTQVTRAEDGTLVEKSQGMAFIEGATGHVTFIVTDESVESYEITDVYTDNTEVGQPVAFGYNIVNRGNVDSRPTKVVVSLRRVDSEGAPRQFTIDESDLSYVGPSQEQQDGFTLETALTFGDYVADVVFYGAQGVIYTENGIIFSVYPPGTLGQEVKFQSMETDAESYKVNDLVGIVGKIENSGTLVSQPVLYINVLKEGQRIEFIKEGPKTMLQKQKADYLSTFRPSEPGQYLLQAFVEYGAQKTENIEVAFEVFSDASEQAAATQGDVQASSQTESPVTSDDGRLRKIGYGILIVLILILLFIIIKRLREDDDEYYDEFDPNGGPAGMENQSGVNPSMATQAGVPPAPTAPPQIPVQGPPLPTAPSTNQFSTPDAINTSPTPLASFQPPMSAAQSSGTSQTSTAMPPAPTSQPQNQVPIDDIINPAS
ncbi:hypothetical protein H6758_04405 [Candidatus Nomurabacteria bacterium]|nr:hypothetical protein [Candidatus Nomurabacteria bacterium]